MLYYLLEIILLCVIESITYPDDKVQRRRDYIMENSFELLEEPDENSYTTGNGVARVRIFRTVNSFSHPIQTMVSAPWQHAIHN